MAAIPEESRTRSCKEKSEANPDKTPSNSTLSSVERPQSARHLVHWCRRGLRLHDQPALLQGLKDATTFRIVYLLDPWFVSSSSNSGIAKWRFLLQSLEDLDMNLRKLNSRLFVIRGQPADVFPTLFKDWQTTHLSFEDDPEPYGKIRDANLAKLCSELGIHVIQRASHTLYCLEEVLERCGGSAPLTLAQFQSVIAAMDPPIAPVPRISAKVIQGAYTPFGEDHDRRYGVPTLEELGFKSDPSHMASPWKGGETEALLRLEHHLEHKAWVAAFGRPKMTPHSLMGSTQTGLSPYLRFGCLSARLFYQQLSDLYKKLKKCNPPLSLHGQLLWREFFYCAATSNAHFDRMGGNPICVQIGWDSNPEALAKWANAQTGFPWIDAIQTQLRQEGWIHQVARHATVCFLTRGTLWISWEECMRIFDELLIDADWSVNAGTCMWLSGSSFFQQILHLYCPVAFGRKVDPNGDYIRRYLPVLRHFPAKYIHEPWVAPVKIQSAAKCLIGQDYPLPMIDHREAAKTNMQRMRQVYKKLTHND